MAYFVMIQVVEHTSTWLPRYNCRVNTGVDYLDLGREFILSSLHQISFPIICRLFSPTLVPREGSWPKRKFIKRKLWREDSCPSFDQLLPVWHISTTDVYIVLKLTQMRHRSCPLWRTSVSCLISTCCFSKLTSQFAIKATTDLKSYIVHHSSIVDTALKSKTCRDF